LAKQGRLGRGADRRGDDRREHVRARGRRPALALPHASRERGMGRRAAGRADASHARGEHVLKEGDVVCFPRGKEGAHQIRNDTDSPVRILMLSTLIAPDIVEYLDTGKVGARSVQGERIIFSRPGPEVDYWEGED